MGKVKDQLWTEPEHDMCWPHNTTNELEQEQETDMHISEMTHSNFLKKEDVDPAILVTVSGIEQKDVSMADQPAEMKWCLYLAEVDKPLVLNQTNIQLCSIACGSENTDDWTGKKIVLFNDPTVSYAGKITGGIRIRAPRNQPAQQPAQQAAPASAQNAGIVDPHGFNDDVPF